MRKIIFLFLLLNFNFIYTQNSFTISGYVQDNSNNELIIGASIIVKELQIGTVTNNYGFFIDLVEGDYDLIFQSLGFEDQSMNFILDRNISVNIFLNENIETLDEVILSKNIEDVDVELPLLSMNILSGNTIRQTPVVLVNLIY